MSKKQNVSPLHPQAEQGKPAEEQQSPIPGMSLKDYSVNLRKTTQAVKDMNLQEIEHCKHNIEQLERENLDKLELPILVHNFILLAPQHRFKLLDDIESLLRELVRQFGPINVLSKVRRDAVTVINDIKEVRKIDTEAEYAQVDISQFLTAFFHFMFKGKLQDNHEQRKILKNIRDYMTEKLKDVLANKQRTVRECDEILSKKLAGE